MRPGYAFEKVMGLPPPRSRKPTFRSLLPLAGLILASCGDGPSGPPVSMKVVVTPAQEILTVTGETFRFSAQVLGKKGKVLTGIPVTWSSSPSAVAEIDAGGVATATGAGVAQIRATAAGVVGQATLTVDLRPVHAEIVSGEGQTGVVEAVLGEPLQVRITDGAGFPVPGVSVAFTVVQGGGSVSPHFVVTGAGGTANAQWTLGPDPAEQQRVVASVGELSADFHASADWPLPHIVTQSLNNGRSTLEYQEELQATGGNGAAFLWSLVGGALPSGMVLSSQGELTGTPVEEGLFNFTVQVQDSEEEIASGELALRVCPAPVPLAPGEASFFDPTGGTGGCGLFIPAGDEGDRYRVAILRSESNRDPEDVFTVSLEVRGLGVEPSPALPLEWVPSPPSFQDLPYLRKRRKSPDPPRPTI